jgi:hypothetical protein
MAKNDEVAHSFQPLMGAHGGQVADPVIEAGKLSQLLNALALPLVPGAVAAALLGALVTGL